MSEIKKKTATKKKPVKEEKKVTKKVSAKKVEPKKAETKKEKKVVIKNEVKTTKKEKGILNNKEKKYFKVLSKIVQIIAKVGKVCLMIFVPFIFLVMLLVPILFKNFEVSGNIVRFGDVSVIVRDDDVSLKLGNDIHVLECNTEELDRIILFLNDNTKGSIITFVELSLLLFAVVIIINIYLLSYLEKLFNNFVIGDTPFTKENTNYILKVGILIVVIKFIDICLSIAGLFPYINSSYSIIEILIIFVIYLVFKYATGIQKKVETNIYD